MVSNTRSKRVNENITRQCTRQEIKYVYMQIFVFVDFAVMGILLLLSTCCGASFQVATRTHAVAVEKFNFISSTPTEKVSMRYDQKSSREDAPARPTHHEVSVENVQHHVCMRQAV